MSDAEEAYLLHLAEMVRSMRLPPIGPVLLVSLASPRNGRIP